MTKEKNGKQLVGLWNIPEMLEYFKSQGLNDEEAHDAMIKEIVQSFKNFEKNNSSTPTSSPKT